MKRTLIQNAVVVNEGRKVLGSVVIENEKIAEILVGGENATAPCDEIIDATGCYLLPGAIDEHVHFRDPGLTHKADITTESRAAAAGGVTSIMDMPNTNPQTTTLEALEEKFVLLGEKSAVNYSCYFGATNNNYTQFAQLDKHRVCGVKLFMGSSTGNMLVDRMASLRNIFGGTDLLIAAHCEDQGIIKENTDKYKKEYGDDVPLALHPLLRSEEACYRSSELAVQLARETNARLHIMHISTAKELSLFSNVPLVQKKITAEACVSHLLFTEEDYQTLGTRIKCNPAKNIDDCVTYILNYVQRSGCNGFTDGEIFGQAVHYYDENEIEVGKPIQCQVAVNHVVELTAEEKAEARQNAVRRYQEEELRKLQNRSKPRTATKATAQEVQQPNLFNF